MAEQKATINLRIIHQKQDNLLLSAIDHAYLKQENKIVDKGGDYLFLIIDNQFCG